MPERLEGLGVWNGTSEKVDHDEAWESPFLILGYTILHVY
jgi:hypothetical protein